MYLEPLCYIDQCWNSRYVDLFGALFFATTLQFVVVVVLLRIFNILMNAFYQNTDDRYVCLCFVFSKSWSG